MGQIRVEKNVGGISGLCVITPAVHGDNRGYFTETWNENDLREAGLDFRFVQDNQSGSVKASCGVCIFRSVIRKQSWFALSGARCLTWRWIFDRTARRGGNGTGNS